MTDLRKAAEMALETLEGDPELLVDWLAKLKEVKEALRQALAMERFSEVSQEIEEELKQPKREWVGLTDEERWEVTSKKWWDWEDSFDIDGFARAIEAKLKEKNT
jgi:hypothetical protein